MSIVDRWLLPDGVEDILPPEAARIEETRRRLLDLFSSWGYDYVIPPIIEYLESLLTGTGRDLDLKTLKTIDVASGRTMGLRADITPQVARIDAHSLNRSGIVRLCYAGTVVHSKPDGLLESRTPISVGAELFSDSSSNGDVEIVSLMLESLHSLGLEDIKLSLGDVAVYRQLVEAIGLNLDQQEQMFAAVQMKSSKEIGILSETFGLTSDKSSLLRALPGFTGDLSILDEARLLFVQYPAIKKCLDNLQGVAERIRDRYEDIDIYFDLSELRGYQYHTGVVFSSYVKDVRQIVAKGGRYDYVGEVFGREGRSATGFSINIGSIVSKTSFSYTMDPTVLVLGEKTPGLWEKINRLRRDGYRVVESGERSEYDYVLIHKDGAWVLTQGEK